MLFVVVAVVSLLSTVQESAAVSFDTGSSVYQLRCSGCHGSAGEGLVGPSLQDSTRPLASVISQITNGAGTMPSFADELTAAEIEAVAPS